MLKDYTVKYQLWERTERYNTTIDSFHKVPAEYINSLPITEGTKVYKLKDGFILYKPCADDDLIFAQNDISFPFDNILDELLDAGDVKFGRSPDADIIVDPMDDRVVSRDHGNIFRGENGNINYEDMSRYGSELENYDGESVKTKKGDIITLFPFDYDSSEKSVFINFGSIVSRLGVLRHDWSFDVSDYKPSEVPHYGLEIIVQKESHI